MQPGGALVIDLHAVHAHVARAGVGVAGYHAGQRKEASAVQRPALLDGEVQQGGRAGVERGGSAPIGSRGPRRGAWRGSVEVVDDFLAGAVFDALRPGVAEVERGAEQLEGLFEAGGRFGFHEGAERGGGFLDRGGAQAQRHAPIRAQRVDGEREGRDLPVDGRLLHQQGLAAAGLLHFAVGQFGNLQFAGHRLREAPQLAGRLQMPEKVA